MMKEIKPGSPEWMLQLKRMNTPTIYNGWEQVTKHDASKHGFNIEETKDFMPEMGPMVGRAVTVKIQPSNANHKKNVDGFIEYYKYLAETPGPKIAVVQDLDKPHTCGAFWGEVTANSHRQLGCVGGIIDGAIRDLDEMKNAGYKALARRLCVGHAHSWPVEWGCTVEVFGRQVKPGQLIHADKHGFLVIPEEDITNLLEASLAMDRFECESLIAEARSKSSVNYDAYIENLRDASKRFGESVQQKFRRKGEW